METSFASKKVSQDDLPSSFEQEGRPTVDSDRVDQAHDARVGELP
jgi:hypothetical protein